MVLLDAECEEYVYMWKCMCEESGVPHAEFVEPDIGDQMTALAILPGDKLKEIRHLQLALKENHAANSS